MLISCGLAVSCSYKTVLPVADLSKIKPLGDNQKIEKQVYFAEAMKHFELEDWKTAEALFRKTISIDAGCDACYYQLANIYFQANYPLQATSLSQSAVRLDPENFWYRLQLSQIYAATGEYSAAINEYRLLMEERPSMENLYFDLASLYARVNLLDSALMVLERVTEKVGFSEQAAGAQIELLMAQDKQAEAIAKLEQLVEIFPEARYYVLLGEQYATMQRDSLSLQMFRNALALNAGYPSALLGETDYYRRTGDFEMYFQKLNAFCENEKISDAYKVDYLSAMLQIPTFAQTFSGRIDSVFLFLRTPPTENTEPLYATYLLQTARPDSASAVLKRNMANNPASKQAWHQYLAVEYYGESWDTLNAYAGTAISKFPDEPDFMSMKAMALWQMHREPEAIEWLEKSLPLIADDSKQLLRNYAFLGDLYYSQKKSKKAYEYYDRALTIDSTSVIVLNNYAYFLSEENKSLDKAYAMSKKAIEAEPDNATYLDTFGWILYKMGKAIEAKAIFRHAMIYGGKESAVILDHYGDVLHALGEKDMAVLYWEMALQKEPLPEIRQKIKAAN
jgi:tetratricopeptide (TPR) repeat protein